MNNPNTKYMSFTISEEYPTNEAVTKYSAFVWCKGEHYKAMVYGIDIEDSMWGFGDTAKEAVEQAIDDYWYYENLCYAEGCEDNTYDIDKDIQEMLDYDPDLYKEDFEQAFGKED